MEKFFEVISINENEKSFCMSAQSFLTGKIHLYGVELLNKQDYLNI